MKKFSEIVKSEIINEAKSGIDKLNKFYHEIYNAMSLKNGIIGKARNEINMKWEEIDRIVSTLGGNTDSYNKFADKADKYLNDYEKLLSKASMALAQVIDDLENE